MKTLTKYLIIGISLGASIFFRTLLPVLLLFAILLSFAIILTFLEGE